MGICVNCYILLPSVQQHQYHAVDLSPELVTVIEEWCGREITPSDQLCEQCMQLVIQANNRIDGPNDRLNRQTGHICVCLCCGISLSRRTGRRRHRLSERSSERTYIENQIFPRQLPNEAWACHPCWMRAYLNAPPIQPMEPIIAEPAEVPNPIEQPLEEIFPEPSSATTMPSSETGSWADRPIERLPLDASNSINLQNYTRTPDTPNCCFVPDCVNTERLRVPRYLKRTILSQYKLYITPSARVCLQHSVLFNWDILNEYEFTSSFTATHIENMLNLLSSAPAGCILKERCGK